MIFILDKLLCTIICSIGSLPINLFCLDNVWRTHVMIDRLGLKGLKIFYSIKCFCFFNLYNTCLIQSGLYIFVAEIRSCFKSKRPFSNECVSEVTVLTNVMHFKVFQYTVIHYSNSFVFELFSPTNRIIPKTNAGPAEGEGLGGLQPPPHFFGNFKELLRKRCFQPLHFESLFSPPTFKVAPRALKRNAAGQTLPGYTTSLAASFAIQPTCNI